MTKIAYTSPNTTNIPDPADVTFTYDAAGNRKYMSDESGTLAYTFNELSRITSETKVFAGTLVNAPSGGYKLEYTYHLSGGIKSIKDPNPDPYSTNGWEVTYASDKTGRTTSIGAPTGFPVSSFASSISYRAFGGVKSMTYSTTTATNVSLTYDDRLRPATYEAESSANTTDIHNKTYTYNNDGSIKLATNTLDANYSQKYEYDFAARLKKNKMGGLVSGAAKYDQELGYDAFSNLTSRDTTQDGTTQRDFTAGYTNNRKTSGGFGSSSSDVFDTAGNVIYNMTHTSPPDHRSWKFDASGRMTDWEETTVYAGTTRWDQGERLVFDGAGRAVKREKRSRQWASPVTGWVYGTEYTIYSSVTGQPIAELDSTGQWRKRNVNFNGTVIAEQTPGFGVVFKHTDPVAGSVMQTETDGEITGFDIGRLERASLNTIIPTTPPESSPPPHDFSKGSSTHNPETGCQVNSAPISCRRMNDILRARGLLFAGNHRIIDTWQEKHKITVDGPIPEDASLRGLLLERGDYEGFRWELVGSSIIELPGNTEVAEFSGTQIAGQTFNTSGIAKVPKNCEDAIKILGEDIWARVQELLNSPPLFDIERLPGLGLGMAGSMRVGDFSLTPSAVAADDPGRLYFGPRYAFAGETVGQTFDRRTNGGMGAWAVRGAGITDGIYFRGSRTSFAGNFNFLLHEVVHLAFPVALQGADVDLDETLVQALGIKKDKDQSYSAAVDRFFSSGCERQYWSPPQ